MRLWMKAIQSVNAAAIKGVFTAGTGSNKNSAAADGSGGRSGGRGKVMDEETLLFPELLEVQATMRSRQTPGGLQNSSSSGLGDNPLAMAGMGKADHHQSHSFGLSARFQARKEYNAGHPKSREELRRDAVGKADAEREEQRARELGSSDDDESMADELGGSMSSVHAGMQFDSNPAFGQGQFSMARRQSSLSRGVRPGANVNFTGGSAGARGTAKRLSMSSRSSVENGGGGLPRSRLSTANSSNFSNI